MKCGGGIREREGERTWNEIREGRTKKEIRCRSLVSLWARYERNQPLYTQHLYIYIYIYKLYMYIEGGIPPLFLLCAYRSLAPRYSVALIIISFWLNRSCAPSDRIFIVCKIVCV